VTGLDAGPGRRADGTEYREGGPAILAALGAAAAAGRTGTAWLMGGNIGALHFRDGRVVGAELEGAPWVRTLLVNSGRLTPAAWEEFVRAWARAGPEPGPAIPAATGPGPLEWALLTREATVEAAFELLPPNRPEVLADMVFRPDAIPAWTGAAEPVEFAALQIELSRRQCVLERLRPFVAPDSALVRTGSGWAGPIQVSAPQWRLLSAVSDGSTPRSLARGLGVGVLATTLRAAQLVRLGLIAVGNGAGSSPPAPGAFPATLFSAAATDRRTAPG
jgi:hypothetical protein